MSTWTEAEFIGFLEQSGIPVTDAIREEIERDQSDPKKWVAAPGLPMGCTSRIRTRANTPRNSGYLLAKTQPLE